MSEAESRRGPEFITQQDIANTPKSNWYRYVLFCGHEAYTRVRLSFRVGIQQHFILCKQCNNSVPTKWQPVESVEAVTDEHVSNVLDGSKFILPKSILRNDGPKGGTPGNPFPYATRDRDY